MKIVIFAAIFLLILPTLKRKTIKVGKAAIARSNLRRLQGEMKPEQFALKSEITIDSADAYVVWEEPNRAETPTLHIGGSGERYSTLTGVSWLDDDTFIVNHRSGLRMAIFDQNDLPTPKWTSELDCPTDDIAAKRLDASTWEICVSGCWSLVYERYQIKKNSLTSNIYQGSRLEALQHVQKDFSHGVTYDGNGQLCYAVQAGIQPRINIGGTTHVLPRPWGARAICHDETRNRYITVAVSANPRRAAYGGVQTTLWTLEHNSNKWVCLGLYDNVHSDALGVWNDLIWMPDQVNNRLLAVDAENGNIEQIHTGNSLDFPHGLDISPTGKIAITNYGTSSVTIVNADSLSG